MRNKTAAKVSATEKSGSAFHKKIEQFSEPDDVVSCSSHPNPTQPVGKILMVLSWATL